MPSFFLPPRLAMDPGSLTFPLQPEGFKISCPSRVQGQWWWEQEGVWWPPVWSEPGHLILVQSLPPPLVVQRTRTNGHVSCPPDAPQPFPRCLSTQASEPGSFCQHHDGQAVPACACRRDLAPSPQGGCHMTHGPLEGQPGERDTAGSH